MSLRQSVVGTIDVGFGTTSVVVAKNEDATLKIRTFPSVTPIVESQKHDITGGSLAQSRNVIVEVNGNNYEVGEDVSAIATQSNQRILNSSYISSDQYQALFLGALSMIETDNDVIDLLVGGLPVSNMHRRKELEDFMVGEHKVGGRVITVKNAWAVTQPLGGLLAYANDGGQELFNAIVQETVLTIDAGYMTLDWLLSSRMIANDARSGAADLGMSKILYAVCDAAASVFGVDKMYPDTIDKAFFSSDQTLKVMGTKYPFPVCEGVNAKGEKLRVSFNFTDQIQRVCRESAQAIKNSVGDGQDVDRILITGGPADVYKDAIKDVYPHHRIDVVSNSLRAIVIGMHIAGVNRMKRLQNTQAA